MFDEPKTSLGDLDEDERGWMLVFLNGTPWEELFESLGGGSAPPSWLVEWSANWVADSIFTIDEMDPYWCDGLLVTDSSNAERWLVVEECDETFSVFERITEDRAIAQSALNYLKGFGHFPILGRLQINPVWMPLPRMRAYMKDAMQDAGQTYLQGDPNLTLEQWLKREYEDDHEQAAAQTKRLR